MKSALCPAGLGGSRANSLKPQKNIFLRCDVARHRIVFLLGAVSKWAGEFLQQSMSCTFCTSLIPPPPPISSVRQYLSADRPLFSARAAVIDPSVGYHGTGVHCGETVPRPPQRLRRVLFAHSTQNFISGAGN